MIAATDIKVTRVKKSRLPQLNLDKMPFGKVFTDHMLQADYENGEWANVEIKPYAPLLFHPSLAAVHYGQAIFEGIKAYKNERGEAAIFRPYDNFKRFNKSARRMQMPEIPEEIFIEGMKQVINLDLDWIPTKPDHSLYIRPVMFATDEALGVKPSDNYKFFILLSPTGHYYADPMKIYVEENYTRAAPGGVGFSKNAGNYGGSLLAAQKAKEQGYDQVLWTDAFEHKWLQEVGSMNVIFIIGDKAVTPDLVSGTILEGVTRDSVLTLLKESGITVEERPLHIDEVIEAHKAGTLKEVFGTGTAAIIAPVKELRYKNTDIKLDVASWKISPMIKDWITGIREGKREDKWGWMEPTA